MSSRAAYVIVPLQRPSSSAPLPSRQPGPPHSRDPTWPSSSTRMAAGPSRAGCSVPTATGKGTPVRCIVRAAPSLGISHLTLYAFSSDNWRRPVGEVAGLMRVLDEFVRRETRGAPAMAYA